MQNDDLDKIEFSPCIDVIYRHLVLTIINTAGNDSQSSLLGIQQGTETQVQTPFTIKRVTLVQTLDLININSIGYSTESN